jgi:spore maturation protein CgeB
MIGHGRILYIGQLWQGGTCLERMRLLEGLGYHIVPFDTTPWIAEGSRWERSLAHRTNWGQPVRGLNHALAAFTETLRDVTHIWIDKGRWIYPSTMRFLKEQTGAICVHYTPDPQLLHHRSRHFNDCIPLYDLLVTTKPFELSRYKAAGGKQVLMVLQGYDDRFAPRIPSAEAQTELGSDVCFVGHCEGHYARQLQTARTVTDRLKIWGPQWRRYSRIHSWARKSVVGDGIWGERYPLALASARIALGLLSKRIPETTTTRSFEIPATGVFMLAERTDEHQALFEEGVETEFFGNEEELVEKVVFYLKHDTVRKKIAAAGRERCLKSGYHSRDQLLKILMQIQF